MDWVLNIEDIQPQGNGDLIGWELKMCTEQVGPNVIVLAEQTEICAGESIDLTAFGADSYIWFPSENLSNSNQATVTATLTETTTFILIGTDASGSNQTEVTITVNDFPEMQIMNLPDSILDANSIALIGDPSGGTFSGPGVDANTLDPYYSQSGWVDISYTYTDALGCANTAVQQVYIGIATDIENTISDEDFNVYQTENDIWLDVKNADALQVQIFDLKGAVVYNYQQNFDSGLHPLKDKILNLAKGVYVLKVKNNTIFKTLKFYQI